MAKEPGKDKDDMVSPDIKKDSGSSPAQEVNIYHPRQVVDMYPKFHLPPGWGIGYLPHQFRDEDGLVLSNLRHAIATHGLNPSSLRHVYRGPSFSSKVMAECQWENEKHPNTITLVTGPLEAFTEDFKLLRQGLINLPISAALVLVFVRGIQGRRPLFGLSRDEDGRFTLETRNGRVRQFPPNPVILNQPDKP